MSVQPHVHQVGVNGIMFLVVSAAPDVHGDTQALQCGRMEGVRQGEQKYHGGMAQRFAHVTLVHVTLAHVLLSHLPMSHLPISHCHTCP